VNYSSDREGAERVAQAIIGNGGEAIAVGADVSKAADVAQLFKEVDSAFGRLDVLVNNAGVFRFGALAEITEQSFHLHYDVNECSIDIVSGDRFNSVSLGDCFHRCHGVSP
jgi:3-oxoacyl-[acyl-carrier protein] reductase